MKDYTSWLDGQSVAHGTLSHVEAEARKAFAASTWGKQGEWPKATLRITRGARQLFVKSVILERH